MNSLLSGIHQFHAQVFKREKDFYSKLVAGQSPSTLFIGCSDSRVDPSIITQSDLGELFVLRNAGNIVPCYGASNGGEPATIEYALLQIEYLPTHPSVAFKLQRTELSFMSGFISSSRGTSSTTRPKTVALPHSRVSHRRMPKSEASPTCAKASAETPSGHSPGWGRSCVCSMVLRVGCRTWLHEAIAASCGDKNYLLGTQRFADERVWRR